MNQEKIGKFIKEIRIKNHLTQAEFAKLFVVTYQAVSKWETGKNIPDLGLLQAICQKYNVDINELLNGQKKSFKIGKYGLIIGIVILVVVCLIIFLLLKNNTFEFKKLSTSCNNFEITGSLAYNKDKKSIYISNINYCGKDDNKVYKNITCKLYEKNDGLEHLINTCPITSNITIDKYLNDLQISINDYTSICHKYDDSSLYLLINAEEENGKVIDYKIPITLSDNC